MNQFNENQFIFTIFTSNFVSLITSDIFVVQQHKQIDKIRELKNNHFHKYSLVIHDAKRDSNCSFALTKENDILLNFTKQNHHIHHSLIYSLITVKKFILSLNKFITIIKEK